MGRDGSDQHKLTSHFFLFKQREDDFMLHYTSANSRRLGVSVQPGVIHPAHVDLDSGTQAI
jgi:hypothetical protein